MMLRDFSPWLKNTLALLLGACVPLAFAPFEYRFIVFIVIPLLILLLENESAKLALWRSFVFGAGMYTVGVSWVYNSLYQFGQSPAWLAIVITGFLVLAMAAFVSLVGYGFGRINFVAREVRLLVIFPALWLLSEWLHSWVLTGFPWLLLGYSRIDTYLAGYVPVIGVLGTGAVVVHLSGALVLLCTGSRRQKIIALAAVLLCVLVAIPLGRVSWTEPAGKTLQVSVVQGNIPQDIKLLPDALDISLSRYLELTRPYMHNSDIIVWPETAIPEFKHRVGDFLQALERELKPSGAELITGIFVYDFDTLRYYNSMYKVGSESGLYYKQHLVPFGEYMPFRSLLLFLGRLIHIPMSDISSGGRPVNPIRLQGVPVAVSICYESAYADIFRAELPAAQLLINSSNDAWFGDSLAPHQHLEIIRARALESGRYMLRATNNGISAVIDVKGRLQIRSQQFRQEIIRAKVRAYTGATPFVRFGNALSVLLAMGAIAVFVGLNGRGQRTGFACKAQ